MERTSRAQSVIREAVERIEVDEGRSGLPIYPDPSNHKSLEFRCTMMHYGAFRMAASIHISSYLSLFVHICPILCLILSLVVTDVPLLVSQCVHDILCVPCICTYNVYSPDGICKGCKG